MFFFPLKKFLICYAILLLGITTLKWAVDGCIPNVKSPVFPYKTLMPEPVCEWVFPWAVYSKTQQERVEKQKNWFNEGPNAFEDDDGKPSVVLFSNDLMKLPVLLELVPADSSITWQILGMMFLIATLLALMWQWWVSVKNTPLDYDPYYDSFTIPKTMAAAQSILPEYLTSEKKKDKPKRDPGKKASGSHPILRSSVPPKDDTKH